MLFLPNTRGLFGVYLSLIFRMGKETLCYFGIKTP